MRGRKRCWFCEEDIFSFAVICPKCGKEARNWKLEEDMFEAMDSKRWEEEKAEYERRKLGPNSFVRQVETFDLVPWEDWSSNPALVKEMCYGQYISKLLRERKFQESVDDIWEYLIKGEGSMDMNCELGMTNLGRECRTCKHGTNKAM